jgi:hypothetical protein
MVARRRVNVKRNVRRVFPVRLLLLLTVVATFALSYLWLCGRCQSLARDLKRSEDRLAEIRRRRLNEEYKWSNLCTLKRVRDALAAFRIEMDWPGKDRVVYLTRPVDIADLPSAPGPQFAQTRGRERRE